MTNKLKLTILLLTICIGTVLFFTLRRNETEVNSLSLSFQRYSDLDPHVQNVGFFWLTNASERPFLLCMTGGSNTLVLDTVFIPYKGKPKESYMVNCAFSDQTPQGWTNWVQEPSLSKGSHAPLKIAPHSGIVIRVPLPTNGQKRKVAVLCQVPLTGWRQWPLWSGAFGQALLRLFPRSMLRGLAGHQPKVLKIWCDRELSHPGE